MSGKESSDQSSDEGKKLYEDAMQKAYEEYMRMWTPEADAYFDAYQQREQVYDLETVKKMLNAFKDTGIYQPLISQLTQMARSELSAAQFNDIIDAFLESNTIAEASESSTKAARLYYEQVIEEVLHSNAIGSVSVLGFLSRDEMMVRLSSIEEIITTDDSQKDVYLLETRLAQYSLIHIPSLQESEAIPILETRNPQIRKYTSHVASNPYTFKQLLQGRTFIPLPHQVTEMTRRVQKLDAPEILIQLFPDRNIEGELENEGLNSLPNSILSALHTDIDLYIGK